MSLERNSLSSLRHAIDENVLQSYNRALNLNGKGDRSVVFFASYEPELGEDVIEQIITLIGVGIVEVKCNYVDNLGIYEWTIRVVE